MPASLPARPRRDADLAFRRPADGALVEAWVTRHRLRSRDRVLAGTDYFRVLAAVDGHVLNHLPQRHPDPDTALAAFRGLFASRA